MSEKQVPLKFVAQLPWTLMGLGFHKSPFNLLVYLLHMKNLETWLYFESSALNIFIL